MNAFSLSRVFAILANREYRVLKHNLDLYRQRFEAGAGKPYPQMDLGSPPLGFVREQMELWGKVVKQGSIRVE